MADPCCLIKSLDLPGKFTLFPEQHRLKDPRLRVGIEPFAPFLYFFPPRSQHPGAPGGSFFAPYNCRIFQIKIDLFPAFIDSPVKLSGIARKFRKRKGSFQPDTHAFSQTVQCFFFSCTFDISNGIFF